MADRADVFVRNMIGEDKDVVVTHTDQGGPSDTTIEYRDEKGFQNVMPEHSLTVKIPDGMDMSEHPLKVVTSITDMRISCSQNKWEINIFPNDLPPDVPTTVNITASGVGE